MGFHTATLDGNQRRRRAAARRRCGIADVADQRARQRRRGDPAGRSLDLQAADVVLRQQGQQAVVGVLADAPGSRGVGGYLKIRKSRVGRRR